VLAEGWWQDTAQEIIALVRSFRGELSSLARSPKSDNTLVTEADMAVQDMIIQSIRRFDTDSIVIAEEDGVTGNGSRVTGSAGVWIVDPIDGTSQFVEAEAVEFCTAIARYEGGLPVAALIVAPELGIDRTPIVIEVSIEGNVILVNQEPYRPAARELTGCASTTRRPEDSPCLLEECLLDKNYEVKTSATSQTLDMVRTVIDLTALAPHAKPFDLFHRRRQKLWDGAAGICLAVAAGLTVADENGDGLLPLPPELLEANTPLLASSVICHPELVEGVLKRRMA
jgi:3'(2'), 5'-bisphosphate nucleotidase